jgi:ABC-type Fe2+-enterobactin transport system substrate-binding protein
MAKVEMYTMVGGDDPIPVVMDSSFDEYADKVWQEFQLTTLVGELTQKRKVVQRKIDAVRKRLKRLTGRLNVMEKNWNPA